MAALRSSESWTDEAMPRVQVKSAKLKIQKVVTTMAEILLARTEKWGVWGGIAHLKEPNTALRDG